MTCRPLAWALPLLGALATCTLTTPLDDLQGGAGGAEGGGARGGGSAGGSVMPDASLDAAFADDSKVIATGQRGLRGIAFHRSLYWVDAETPAIWMADRDGADLKRVLTAEQKVNDPYDVDVSDKHIYWTEFSGSLWRATGLSTMSLGGTLPRAAFLAALDDTTQLVSDLQGDANGRTVWKQGTRLYSRMKNVMGLGHEGNNVYWAEPEAIFQGATDGRDPVKVAAIASASGGVATNGIDIFWIESERELWRQALGDPTSKRLIHVSVGNQRMFDVAASATYVFWTDPGTETVRRLDL